METVRQLLEQYLIGQQGAGIDANKPLLGGLMDTRTFQGNDPSNTIAQRQIGSQAIGTVLPNNPYRQLAEQALLANTSNGLMGMVGSMKVYHGSNANFPKLKKVTTLDDFHDGASVTPSFDEALSYAQERAKNYGGSPHVMEYDTGGLNIKNIGTVIDYLENKYGQDAWEKASVKKVNSALKELGIDGTDYDGWMPGYGIRVSEPSKLQYLRTRTGSELDQYYGKR